MSEEPVVDLVEEDEVGEHRERPAKVRAPRLVVWGVVALGALLVVTLITTVVLAVGSAQRSRAALEEERARVAREQERTREAEEYNTWLREQYERVWEEAEQGGLSPAAPAPEDLPEAPTPPATSVGPSNAQVFDAVVRYCTLFVCGETGDKGDKGDPGDPGEDSTVPGPQGDPGDPGPPPTPEQVASAVAAFCGPSLCQGPPGDPGTPGPGPTVDQIASAVAAYCSTRDECAGQPGPTCPPGTEETRIYVQTRTDPFMPQTQRWRESVECLVPLP